MKTVVEYRVAYDAPGNPPERATYEVQLADPTSLTEARSRLELRKDGLLEAFYTNVRIEERTVTRTDWKEVENG